METLVFFIALCFSCYSVVKLVVQYANFIKNDGSKNYDMTFMFIACFFWGLLYQLNS